MSTEDKTQKILEHLTIKALEEASDLVLSLQIHIAQLERGVVPAQSPTSYSQYVRALAKLDFFCDYVSATHSMKPLRKTGETK